MEVRGGSADRDAVPRVHPHDAFSNAMAEHGDRLARLAYFLCGDRSRAEDLVAEAFAAAWPRWSAGRVDDLGAYLRRTVVNHASKARRRWGVVVRHGERAAPTRHAPGADEGLGTRIDLARALASLPPHQRVAVVLRYLEDMTEADIATLLAIAPGTVKSRVSRALDTMRAQLGGTDDA
jgi:RNA polymerase sigma-70 factor (sigma-E family)